MAVTGVAPNGGQGADLAIFAGIRTRSCLRLSKNEQDVHLFERLAFMARREGR